jgi:peptidoglycan hydrolase-like protein with peptidoglycan-binding domain
MKRLLLVSLAMVLCGAGSVFADETVSAAQTRLKEGGFYFGQVNGNYDSETAAAVSRYQIRNGLQISGQLDAETAKSLGVAAVAAGSAAPAADSGTWQRLRKSDQQFLSRLNSGEVRPPAPPAGTSRTTTTTRKSTKTAPAPAATVPPTAVPPDAVGGSTLVLSRERLRDYVGAFILAGLDPRVGSELEFFADRVKYYDQGVVRREKIRADLQRYNQRWPQRRFWLAGEVQVEPQPDSSLRVRFPMRYELRSASERSSGKILKTLNVEVTGEDLQIIAVNERKIR